MSIHVEVRAAGLKAARQRVGMTQRELARRLDVTQNYIPAIESNTRRAGPNLRRRLCDALGAGFWDIFEVVLCDDEAGSETRLVSEDGGR